jgi:CRP-like cAMP-binding protein
MFLKESDLFKGLSQQFINEIGNIMVEESYNKGDFVIKEGAPAERFFILQKGEVRLSVGEKGQISLMICNWGEAFGWSSFVDRSTYTSSAECLAPTKLIRIEKEKLEKIFEKDLASGVIFYKRLAGIIGERLINSYRKLLSAYKEGGPPSYG